MWKVNGRQTPSDGESSHCLWQGELKMAEGWIWSSACSRSYSRKE
jgi:hypothetical protein